MTLNKITDEFGDSYFVTTPKTIKRERGFEKISLSTWKSFYKEEDFLETYEDIKIPKRATSKSAGYDFFSPLSFVLMPTQEIKISTGIKAYMMDDEKLMIYPRSGLGFKYYLRLANTCGVVDSDYFNNVANEGNIFIKVRNEGSEKLIVQKGEGFAQGIFEKYLLADGDEFATGNERVGGIGST